MDAAVTDAPDLSDLPVEMTVADAQAAFAKGVTAEALAKAFLARIETYNPRYNALIFLNPHALDEARAIDARRASGEALGPLAGVPVSSRTRWTSPACRARAAGISSAPRPAAPT